MVLNHGNQLLLLTHQNIHPCERAFRRTSSAKISPHFQAYKVKMRIACMQPTEMQPVLNLTNNVVSDEFLIWWSNNLRLLLYLYV